jgi:ABC-type metal ion transport system substrate-binding protein
MELEGAQLPRVLDDPKVDVAIISTTYSSKPGCLRCMTASLSKTKTRRT